MTEGRQRIQNLLGSDRLTKLLSKAETSFPPPPPARKVSIPSAKKQSRKSFDVTLAAVTCSGNSGAEPQMKARRLKGREEKKRIKNEQQMLGF